MRVLFWAHSFLPNIGGVEIFAARLLPALRDRKHDFAVVTSGSRTDQRAKDRYDGIDVYRFPLQDVTSFRDIDSLTAIRRKIAKVKQSFGPDLVHYNCGADFGIFFYLTTASVCPAPLLVTMHGIAGEFSPLASRLLNLADWVNGVSIDTLLAGRKLAPRIIARSSVIYNGLANSSIFPNRLPTDPPHVLYVGRLSPEKGVDLALASVARVVHLFPHTRMTIIGDGVARSDLERQANDLKIRGNVEFRGWVSPQEVQNVINEATLVVIPSRTEGLPLIALEAAFMGRPVVVTKVGGLPEVVRDGQTGIIVEPENASALAGAIEYLFARPSTAAQMGHNARVWAETLFGWERHVNAYDDLYHKVVTKWREQGQQLTRGALAESGSDPLC
jgi:glycosyltransferase involved in cell wall biosynthesis